jgi:predicted nucleic acid-binding Zn ribbon protein
MPVFTFRCRICHKIETVGAHYDEIKHDVMAIAPSCCEERMMRMFDIPKVHYVGSGFFSTDKVLSDPNPDEAY